MILTFALSGVLLVPSVVEAGIPAVDAALWFGLGVLESPWITLYSVYPQATTAKEMLGRTASNLYTFRGITSAVGAISLPFLIQASGIVSTAILTGTLLILMAFVFYASFPSIREMRLRGEGG